jgi:hypothetical protein
MISVEEFDDLRDDDHDDHGGSLQGNLAILREDHAIGRE